jgi:hypothetical protein
MTRMSSRVQEGHGVPRIPFVTTSFAYDLRLFLILWPVWWVAGVEQLLPPLFVAWELVASLVRRKGVLRINTPVWLAICLAFWWWAPVGWVPREHFDIYLKETATVWSQAFLLLVFVNEVRTESDWKLVVHGLTVLGLFMALGSLIFVSGLWRGEFTSLVGHILPGSWIEESAFFRSISIRSFGIKEAIGFSQLRTSSFCLQFSGLSMLSLLLIPWTAWRALGSSRRPFVGAVGLVGLVIGLLFAQSRIAYIALLFGIILYAMITLRRHSDWSLQLALTGLLGAVGLTFIGLFWTDLVRVVEILFIEGRPDSWVTRARVYRETLERLPTHWIAGWGTQLRIPGLSSVFSAGSHSSHLGMLFQHGIVGLALYLSFWLSLWRRIVREGRRSILQAIPQGRAFWTMMAVSMFCFNVREVADTWWWDQTVTMTIWTLWGLILTTRFSQPGDDSEPGSQSSRSWEAETSDGVLESGTLVHISRRQSSRASPKPGGESGPAPNSARIQHGAA